MRIACVVGARPNFVKMAALLEEFRRQPAMECRLIHTGQHYTPEMSRSFFDELELREPDVNLEVGSGSGYAAAVLSLLSAEVYGIELEPELNDRALATVEALGYRNLHLRAGDGFGGWPEKAPFDAILLSCAAEEIPPPLWEQLKTGGRFLYPRGSIWGDQELVLVEKTPQGRREQRLDPVRFVPMRRAK